MQKTRPECAFGGMAGPARMTPRHDVITKTHVQQNAKKVCLDPKVPETGADK
jgi:hypothetical protein